MASGARPIDRASNPATRPAVGEADRVFAFYFVAQAAVGVLFWFMLETSDPLREVFELVTTKRAVTDAFIFADGLVIVCSLLSAWALGTAKAWAVPMVAFTAGGMVYPTLYLIGWVAFEGTGAACLAIMVPPSILTSWIAYEVWRSRT